MEWNFRKLVLSGIVIAGLVFLAQWKISQMEKRFEIVQDKITKEVRQSFKQLSDSVSAQSEVQVVLQPNLFDRMFNTQAKKQYDEIRKLIPEAIKQEMERNNMDKAPTIITKNQIVIQGDSVLFLNSEGVITKTAKVQPINGDSSLLIIVPQEIELTTVAVLPDDKDPSKLSMYVTAYNRTTGDSIRIEKSMTYVLPGKNKKWEFNYKPYIGLNYDMRNGSAVPKAGIDVVTYNSRKFKANIGGLEIRQNLKNQESFVDLKVIQLQFK
jgi:hypothetical protein